MDNRNIENKNIENKNTENTNIEYKDIDYNSIRNKDDLELIRTKYITFGLLAVNVIIWVILEIMGDTENADFMYRWGANYPNAIFENREYYRFFTSTFLHFGAEHLANNMLILVCAGIYLEEALGHMKYLLLYVVAGLGSSILSYEEMLWSGDYAVSAGASGAIFGVLGGLLWVVIVHRGHYETLTTRGMIFMIILSLYYGITTAGVDNWAHLGGLIMGVVACMVLYRKKGKNIDFNKENQYT